MCFETVTDEQLKGPGGNCVHKLCRACWMQIGKTICPPFKFKCPQCRRDITNWYVREFNWQPPADNTRNVDIDAAMTRAQAMLEAGRAVAEETRRYAEALQVDRNASAETLDLLLTRMREHFGPEQ